MKHAIFKYYISVTIALFISLLTNAQWTSDTESNTTINDAAGANYVPKIRTTSDGKFFISWFGGEGNLNMNMQLLDFNGNEFWATNGMVVSGQTQNSFVTDYDLTTDMDGNAVVAFTDVRNGITNTMVYKVSQSGEMLFGENGINPSPSIVAEYVPHVAITTENSVIVAWMRETNDGLTSVIQKIDEDGSKPWGEEGIVLNNDTAEIQNPVPIATSDGGFLLVYYIQTGPFFSPNRYIYGQKYTALGIPEWLQEVELCGFTKIPGFATLQVSADGNDGAIVTWYDDSNDNALANVAVQHMLSDGSLAFETNGIVIGRDDNGSNNFNVIPAAIGSTDDIYVYWSEANGSQSQFGLRGQKIKSNGELLWGEFGKDLIPLNSTFDYPSGVVVSNDTSYVIYEKHTEGQLMNQQIMVKALDTNGEEIYDGDIEISTSNSQKIHSDHSAIYNNQFAVTWEDNGSSNTIKAQNLIIGDTSEVSTGIVKHEYELKVMELRDGSVFILSPKDVTRIDFYNMNGQMIQFNNIISDNPIELSGKVPSGIYFAVALDRAGNTIQVLKFSKY